MLVPYDSFIPLPINCYIKTTSVHDGSLTSNFNCFTLSIPHKQINILDDYFCVYIYTYTGMYFRYTMLIKLQSSFIISFFNSGFSILVFNCVLVFACLHNQITGHTTPSTLIILYELNV
jgi:hypothetical protein